MLGPTGQFPRGPLNPTDEGELHLAVGHEGGNVIVRFGTPVSWFGMPPGEARGLATLLMQHASRAEAEGGYVVELDAGEPV